MSKKISGDINYRDYLAKVTSSTLTVRSGPAADYHPVGSLNVGQKVTVTHHHGHWP